MKKVFINASIRSIVPMFQEQYKAHKIVFTPQKDLPPARLDDDKFQQIMTNLIDNGGKYSEAGSTVLITTESKGDKIIIRVKDEGVGIKKEDSDKLFKKFSRIENHLTSKTQGNGLGLYITKQLVEVMNGQITFESEEGNGTTFIVTFPVYNDEEVLKCSQKS
jgi:signal transduction histidine kinase